MKKVVEKGEEFLQTEKDRLKNLLENKSTAEAKKWEFTKRLNILNTFVKQVIS